MSWRCPTCGAELSDETGEPLAAAPELSAGERLELKGMLFNLLQCAPDDEDNVQINRIIEFANALLRSKASEPAGGSK